MYTEQEQQTIDIVELQLEAYNRRDIEAFAATYHPEVEIAHFSKGLLYSGRETLIKRYGEKFGGLTYLRATSLKRIVVSNIWSTMNWRNLQIWQVGK
ncbi:hypothetical protein OC508_16595 [Vibrio vulnificus]|uniref:hypothetical protein n=1 Tax=Vibrio vulnificus TaxID=672 RepID=UPI0009268AEA|nr:hypothetical protein [Vibrio vulnificus]MCU8399232.1 hypothetical protein [Vibrio vulnificus]OJI39927.1 hypothetical protein VVDAL7940_00069 [Vibrio vulnificus]